MLTSGVLALLLFVGCCAGIQLREDSAKAEKIGKLKNRICHLKCKLQCDTDIPCNFNCDKECEEKEGKLNRVKEGSSKSDVDRRSEASESSSSDDLDIDLLEAFL